MTVPEKLEFEIDHYIKSPVADPECDPLEWWKTHYPFLAKIAKNTCQFVLQVVLLKDSLAPQVKLHPHCETI